MSTSGGVSRAYARARQAGCTAMQVFVKGNTRWQFPPLEDAEVELFREERSRHPEVQKTVAHAIYLVNMATPDPVNLEKTIDDLVDELSRCGRLGISALVVHPGAGKEMPRGEALARVSETIDKVIATVGDRRGPCTLALENVAGQGSTLGVTLAELADMIHGSESAKILGALGVCIDTCHALASGYSVHTPEGFQAFWAEFDSLLGRDRLAAIHINDSAHPLGSRKDRHAHIGDGHIGLEGFRPWVNDRSLWSTPMILETEKGDDMAEDRMNLERLRSLIA